MYVYKKVIIGQLASGLPVLGFKLLEKIKDIDVGKAIEYKEKELDTFVTNFELPKDWCHNYKGLDIIHYTEEYFRNFFSIRKVAEEELLDNYVYLYGKNNDVDEYFVLLDGGDNLIPFKELDNLPTIELLSYFGEQLGFMVLFNLTVYNKDIIIPYPIEEFIIEPKQVKPKKLVRKKCDITLKMVMVKTENKKDKRWD